MRSVRQFVTADKLLIEAAKTAQRAAKACRQWERGGSPEPVGDTAVTALAAFNRALLRTQEEDEVTLSGSDPETRRARLVLAGYMLLLAGTDEHGESSDLTLAASIFRRAAIA